MEIEITYFVNKNKGWKTFNHNIDEGILKNWYCEDVMEYIRDIVSEKANDNVPYKWKIIS